MLWLSVVALAALVGPGAASVLDCSRSDSREARNQIQERILSVAAEDGVEISEDCPLHSTHDMYLPQESMKKSVRSSNWQCTACSKTFKSEFYLDRHLDRKHAAGIATADASVCLADFCSFLDCGDVVVKGGCSEMHMERTQLYCRQVFNKCFPPARGSNWKHWHDDFSHTFCDPLTCGDAPVSKEEPPSAGLAALKTAFTIVGVGGVLIYVLTVVVMQREVQTPGDLHRRHKLPWWKRLFRGKKKRRID